MVAVSANVRLIGGPLDGLRGDLDGTSDWIEVAGFRYARVDDPDTGAYLGAYAAEWWPDAED